MLSPLELARELSNRQPCLQGDGRFTPAVQRDPAQLPDLWGRWADRPAARRQGDRNRVPSEIEQAVLDHAIAHPCQGRCASNRSCGFAACRCPRAATPRGLDAPRAADQARAAASAGEGHRRTHHRADRGTGAGAGALQPEFARAPHRGPAHRRAGRGRHLLRRQATLKGVGKVSMQTVIDCHSRPRLCALYPSMGSRGCSAIETISIGIIRSRKYDRSSVGF